MSKLISQANKLLMSDLGILPKYKNDITIAHPGICPAFYAVDGVKTTRWTLMPLKLKFSLHTYGKAIATLTNTGKRKKGITRKECIARGYKQIYIAHGLLDGRDINQGTPKQAELNDQSYYFLFSDKVNLYGHYVDEAFLEISYREHLPAEVSDSFEDLMKGL